MIFGRVGHRYLPIEFASEELKLPNLDVCTEERRKAELISLVFFLGLLDMPVVSSFPLHLSNSRASDEFG